jgi:hypothetical protein
MPPFVFGAHPAPIGERTLVMSNKLFVHVEPENHFVGHTWPNYEEISRLPLEGGRPYLVQAKGLVGPEAGVFMHMRLEARGFFGEVVATTESSYINDNQEFLLTASANLPAEGGGGSPGTPTPPGASANLLVASYWINPQPGHSASITDIVLTALQVDEIVMA